jgi:uncharacterized protein YdhG (YjbR/CyaY superfamily)
MTTEVDDYLAAVPETSRAALEALRQTIKEALPESTEVISYKVPTFKYQDRPVVAYGATQTGCTFYVMSTDVFNAFKGAVKGYKTGQGSIRFEPDNPLPAELVTKIVKARVAENSIRYR